MDSLLNDLRYALRRLRKAPGFSAIVIITLALGIGANTAIFSVVNAVILSPLGYHEPDRLATVFHFYPNLNNLEAPVSAPGYRDYREKAGVFETAAVETGWGPTLTGIGEPERLIGTRVSADWFKTLGVNPLRGRWLRPDEDEVGKNRVIVLSYGLAQRMFGGVDSVVGKTMTLNGEPHEIVGVMPQSFRAFWNRQSEVWTPIALPSTNFTDNNRTNEFLNFTGRLKPGMTIEAATTTLTAFAEQLKRDFPNNYGQQWTLKPRLLSVQSAGPAFQTRVYILLGAVGFVLLIACANVANLLLARAAARLKEVAVRTALGARRSQLVRQLLTESVVLSLCGGILGLTLAYGAVRAFVSSNPTNIPRVDEIRIDGLVMAFTLGIAVVTGLLFGLVPALQSSKSNLQETLKEGGRSSSAHRAGNAMRETLVVAQVALALILLTGAGLVLTSFYRLQAVDPGFKADHLLTFNLALPAAKYPNDTTWRAYFDQVVPRIEAVPGVKSVGMTSVLPFSGGWSTGSFSVEGFQPPQGQPGPWGDIRIATPGFFPTMDIKLQKGRVFTDQDRLGAPLVAVVDEEMVKRFWPKDDPIGKRVTFGNTQGTAPITWIEVVGVVQHAKHEGLDADPRVQMYLPYHQRSQRAMAMTVRTTGAPLSMTAAIRQAVRSLDQDQPLARVLTMEQMMSNTVGQRRLSTILLGAFAGVALLLASIGIYGVMSYSVTQRSHELGIRMALGAARQNVLTLVVGKGMLLAFLGVLIGVFGALMLTRFISGDLFQVSPRDPWTFFVVTIALGWVGLVATLIPAMRATRVDPVEALRNE